MYQSPISIYETAMETIMEQRENAIFAKIQDAFDVQVDKDELIRALQYDRGQYEQGYRDAMANQRWTPMTEWLPEIGKPLLVKYLGYNNGSANPAYVGVAVLLDDNCWYWWEGDVGDCDVEVKCTITHWMPLPEPPEEDE